MAQLGTEGDATSKPNSRHKNPRRPHACWSCKADKYAGKIKHRDKRERLRGLP